jgi:hypothetical protein
MQTANHHRCHCRLHHHQANIEIAHLLTHSGVTGLEVSLMVSPAVFCLLVCGVLVFLVI